MSTLSGIPSGVAPPTAVAVPATEPTSASPGPRLESAPGPGSPAAADSPGAPAPYTRQEIESAVQELRDAMSRLPVAEREVHLLYEPEDNSYIVEIRNKETGALVQTFPPENLLNLRRRSADLLGVLIDRLS